MAMTRTWKWNNTAKCASRLNISKFFFENKIYLIIFYYSINIINFLLFISVCSSSTEEISTRPLKKHNSLSSAAENFLLLGTRRRKGLEFNSILSSIDFIAKVRIYNIINDRLVKMPVLYFLISLRTKRICSHLFW